jgi:ElaB/YqjD/DUF883 family membrane-anchored ribosome-binding protein
MGIKNFFKNIFSKSKEEAAEMKAKAEVLIDKAEQEIAEKTADLKKEAQEGLQKAKQFGSEAIQDLKEATQEVREEASESFQKAKEFGAGVIEDAKELGHKAMEEVHETIQEIKESEFVQNASEKLDNIFDRDKGKTPVVINHEEQYKANVDQKDDTSSSEKPIPPTS